MLKLLLLKILLRFMKVKKWCYLQEPYSSIILSSLICEEYQGLNCPYPLLYIIFFLKMIVVIMGLNLIVFLFMNYLVVM